MILMSAGYEHGSSEFKVCVLTTRPCPRLFSYKNFHTWGIG